MPQAETVGYTLVERLRAKDWPGVRAMLDGTMQGAMSGAKLEELSSTLEGQGGLGKPTGTGVTTAGEYQTVWLTCTLGKSLVDVKVVLTKDHKVTGLFIVPAGAPAAAIPLPEGVTEVALQVIVGRFELPGTLTLPAGKGPHPGVVLVHGSGAHDQDETIGPNKVFVQLAYGLAARGVAVLRYEKRNHKYGADISATPGLFTVNDETVDDAVAAAALLQQRREVSNVFVLGHSLGGTMMPRIGQRSPGAAGFIIMAGSVRPLTELVAEQLDYISTLGAQDAIAPQDMAGMRAQLESVGGLTAANARDKALLLGAPAAYWLDLKAYRPDQEAKKLARPVLVLQGGRDYQVTMKDFALWKAALQPMPWASLVAYPQLNHLFQTGKGKATPSEYAVAGTLDPAVLDDVARFVLTPSPAKTR